MKLYALQLEMTRYGGHGLVEKLSVLSQMDEPPMTMENPSATLTSGNSAHQFIEATFIRG